MFSLLFKYFAFKKNLTSWIFIKEYQWWAASIFADIRIHKQVNTVPLPVQTQLLILQFQNRNGESGAHKRILYRDWWLAQILHEAPVHDGATIFVEWKTHRCFFHRIIKIFLPFYCQHQVYIGLSFLTFSQRNFGVFQKNLELGLLNKKVHSIPFLFTR